MANRTVAPGIIERNGSYRFTVNLGTDINGKQIRKTETWHAPTNTTTQTKCDKLAKEAYHNFKSRCKGMVNLDEHIRFNELCERYFSIYAANKLKPITAYNYQSIVKNRFSGELGNKKLKDISTAFLSDFFCNLKKSNGNQVSPRTAKKIFTTMESIMHFAVKQGYISKNPCIGVILPSPDPTDEEERNYLTENELPRFLSLFEGYSSFNTMIKVLLYTGLRSGELLGLSWNDIDFENRQIYVNHTLSDVGGRHFLTTPKTKGSKRIVFMSDTVYKLLQEHKENQLELITGIPGYSHPEMVFTSEVGNYKDRSALNTSFRKKLENTEFNFLTLHGLRHSNATLLLNSGIDLKIISEHFGHSTISTTANIYADVLNISRRKTAEVIEFKLAQ